MPKASDLRVLLVRSGQTQWDAAGRVTGSADLPLTDAGRRHIQEEVAALDGARLGVVLCGPDEGSRETAGIVAEATGARVKTVEGLHEMRLGLWEGLRAADLEERYPKAYRQWTDDPAAVLVPDGETVSEAMDRLVSELARSLERVKEASQGVGVVLRPMALALVRCWMGDGKTKGVWTCGDQPDVEWRSLGRDQIRRPREPARVATQ